MADTPSDGTPDTASTSASPPRRRRARGTATATAKTKRGPGEAPKIGRPRKVPAESAPVAAVRRAAASVTRPAGKAAAQVKPRAKRAAKAVADTVEAAGKPRNRTRLIIGATAAVVSVAAGVAASLGRKKIAKVTGDAVDLVIGKSEPEAPKHPVS